jgi:hypothetical protein
MLRVTCLRLGITELSVVGSASAGRQAKISPLDLKLSESMRLKRLARNAIHKENQRQLVVPVSKSREPAAFLVEFLDELIPAEMAPAG